MNLITLDFETMYSDTYTLSKMTTEEYIRDPRFETIMCGFKVNQEKSYWVDAPDVARELDRLDIRNNGVLCHHAHFDGLILSHVYKQYPKAWFDTLSMARAALGQKVPMGLAKLAERFGIGKKGTEVEDARGKHRRDFSGSQIQRYGQYCCNDIDLTRKIFDILLPNFQKSELKIIDMVIRMFTEPVLHLDTLLLEEYVQDIRADKTTALLQAGIQLADVMSNDKFAAALEQLGVMPPTKISLTTGKETFAFAKTDQAMEALAEHPDIRVQHLIAARLKNKTTIAESRAVRMSGMGLRGAAPVYLKYSGAEQTHRLCLTGDTGIKVLRSGVILDIVLSSLESRDLVWDGEAFVEHGGLICHGEKEVISYGGLTGTPDHRIYVEEVDGEVELSEAMQRGYTPKATDPPEQHHIDAARLGRPSDGEGHGAVSVRQGGDPPSL